MSKKSAHTQPKSQKDCDDLCDEVMLKIHNEKICMKSKTHFLIGSTLFGVGLAGALVSSAVFSHITLYKLRYDAALESLGFGALGVRPFMLLFPWVPFFIAIGGIASGLYILRRYDISYRYNFNGLIIGVTALVITSGVLLDQLEVQKQFQRIGLMEMMYSSSMDNVPFIVGIVDDVEDGRMRIHNHHFKSAELEMSNPALRSMDIAEGHKIRAIGEWEGDTFKVRYLRIAH